MSTEAIASALDIFIKQIKVGQAFIAPEELIVASSRKYRAQQLAKVFNQITDIANK